MVYMMRVLSGDEEHNMEKRKHGVLAKGIVANPTMTAKQALENAKQAGEDQNTNMRARSNAFLAGVNGHVQTASLSA